MTLRPSQNEEFRGRVGGSRVCRSAVGWSGPAELVEAVVVDAEVVGDLVDHRDAHLLDDLVLGDAHGHDRLAVDRDLSGMARPP